MAKRKHGWIAGLLGLALLVGGCSQAADNSAGGQGGQAPADKPAAQTAETRTVKDAAGEVTIPANPQRIADVSGSTEELLALGIRPVLTANSQYESPMDLTPILQKELGKDVTVAGWFQNEVSVEAIAAANPDLILVGPAQEKIYEQLNKIAPTVRVPYGFNAFRERFDFVANTLGKKQQMDEWLKAYDDRAKQLHDQIVATTKEESFAVIEATQKGIRLYAKTGLADMIFSDLKLPKAAGIPEPDPWGGKETDLEGLSTLNPDHIVLLADSEHNVLEDTAIWNNMKAKKNGKVYRVTTKQSYNEAFFALGKKAMIEQVAADILQKNQK
ncbi:MULTISPECIES: ABC transporter substrate-binding protein [Brevibacillus]|uniref:ABC transporter substrate-binding protein n=1 Tax=Brevibacillus TaxID=55080 RepID=UPI000EF0135B|nr:ABC transporter substrate-binding protein [Brevibacillus sp.]HBZ81256.1 ABC transporter substrate-binding protein [Brevibacillus sp.]